MSPSQLSDELRNGDSADLKRRRWIVGLSLAGSVISGIVSLYQIGIIKHLPDPPADVFDSDKVDASDYAYKRFQTPDAFVMLFNYALTAWSAAAGGQNRAQETPLLALGMGFKTLTDVAAAAELGREEWQENKELCFYCQMATVVSIASLALSIPETLRALRRTQTD